MRLVCTIPTATSPINGHDFDGQPGNLVSVNDIPDEEAAIFLTVPGYFEFGAEPASAAQQEDADALDAMRDELKSLGVEPKSTWRAARLQAEIAKAKASA